MLRALAYETGSGPPAAPSDVVRRLDRVASRLDVTGFTTLLFGRVSRQAGRTLLRWSNAGHPPPVLVPPDGEPVLLRGGVGVVLGVAPERPRVDPEVELEPGATRCSSPTGRSSAATTPATPPPPTCSTSSAAAGDCRCPPCATTWSAARPPTPVAAGRPRAPGAPVNEASQLGPARVADSEATS